MSGQPVVIATEGGPAYPALRCRVSTCWHRALPDSDLCAGCYAECCEHIANGCSENELGLCEVCENANQFEI